jgi:hypothetical protein
MVVLDTEKLYEAIDRRRRRLGLKRHEVTAIIGVAPCNYSYWSKSGGFSANVTLRVSLWIGEDLRSYLEIDKDAPDRELIKLEQKEKASHA